MTKSPVFDDESLCPFKTGSCRSNFLVTLHFCRKGHNEAVCQIEARLEKKILVARRFQTEKNVNFHVFW